MNDSTSSRPGRGRGIAAAIAGAVLISLVALQPAAADARTPDARTADTPAAASAAAGGTTASPAEIARADTYWTKERMAAATPELPPDVGERALADALADAEAANALPARSAPGATPRHATTATGTDTTATDVTDTIGTAAVTQAQRWGGQGQMPATTTGKVYFTRGDGSGGFCSGSVVTAANNNTVWTAGHCIHPGGTGPGTYHTNIVFVPDADNGLEPHGQWSYKFANTTIGWQDNGDFAYDLAAIAVWPQGSRGDLAGWVGSQGYAFGSGQTWASLHALGFPAAGYQRGDFSGNDLWFCEGPSTAAGSDIRMTCDMRNGTSGGPWLDDLQTARGWGYIVGAYSYHYLDGNGNYADQFMYSANHGDGAINVYNDVSVR
ncbi:trypsin-like serine peptidase [Streptomyces radicis]|uniref:trypsin-like serine peptidase n=1 Tax=Streptomyces radicis TaxID=1750517 RepID=UPI0011C48330|nr:hypothetical protein [Streptomyces radicis]